jgi:hypothetical protein
MRVFSKYRYSLRMYFGHKWLVHFGCANGFLGLCHTFFRWGFISGHGAYWWSSSPGKCPGCFGHFAFMCSSLTLLYYMDSTFFFFLPISFGGFWQKSYAGMWGHYGLTIVGVFSRPFNEALGLTIDVLWWYRLFFYGGLCPIYFFRELGYVGSIFVF